MNKGLTAWKDRLNPMVEFRREFDRLFDDWSVPTRGLLAESQFVPACEIEEKEDAYILTLETAGVKKEDIKMEVMDNQITISGERRTEKKGKEHGRSYSERQFGRFERSFALPTGIDSEKVEAKYEDGILRIQIPKSAAARPREIKISGAEKGPQRVLKETRPEDQVAS